MTYSFNPLMRLRLHLLLGLICLAIGSAISLINPAGAWFLFLCGILLMIFWIIIEKASHEKTHLAAGLELAQIENDRTTETYKNILKSMSSGVLVMDIENRITHINQAALRIFGAEEHQLLGKQIFQIPQFADISRLIAQTLDTVPPYFHTIKQAEIDVPTLSNDTIPLGLSTTVLLDKQEYLAGYLIICQDLTMIKKLREQAERDRRLASLGEMAAGVAHEIRNPLASVMGFASVMDEEIETEHPHKSYLQIMTSEMERASRVIQDILDFSRQAKPIFKYHDINKQLQDLIFQLGPLIQEKSIGVKQNYSPIIEHFEYDADQLHQVFLNLIQNALNVSKNEGSIIIETEQIVSDATIPDKIQIRICDQGPGIPANYQNKIFEPFFTTQKAGKGTGLGLAICSRIVTDHNGSLDFICPTEGGTIFRVTLPKHQS